MQEKSDLEIFLSFLEVGNLAEAKSVFERQHQFIDSKYIDYQGNNLIHYVVISACKIISCLNKTNTSFLIEAMQCRTYFQALVKIMLQYDVFWNTLNNEGVTPFDILNGCHREPYSDFFTLLNSFVEEIERKGSLLYSGKRYVYDLNLYRASKTPERTCNIPDRWKIANDNDGLELTLHQRLAFYRSLLQIKLNYSDDKNLVVANIGFVIANKYNSTVDNSYKPIFLTLPIDSDFLISKPEENQWDGHSENSLCLFLLKKEMLVQFVKKLKCLGYGKGSKIYVVVIDFNSKRMVCDGCSSDLHDISENTGENGFSHTLKHAFQQEYGDEFQFPKKHSLPIIIRGSGMLIYSGGRKKRDLHPTEIVAPEFNRNIKVHMPGSLLHLIPKIGDPLPAFSEDDKQYIAQCKTKANEKLQIFKGRKPGFFMATSFQSAGGNDYTKTVHEHASELSNISQEDYDSAIKIALNI
jgi:hypothetical protein